MDALLEAGASLNSKDGSGETALHYAVDANVDALIIAHLLGHGARAESECELGRTPLISAAAYGRSDVVSLLISHGADPSHATMEGETPLSFAVVWNQFCTARLLIQSGADLGWRDEWGSNLLDYAERDRNVRLIELLASFGLISRRSTSN